MSPDIGSWCCWKCVDEALLSPMARMQDVGMILCRTCGNKRCPKATDHNLTCGKSNDEGQLGSVYGVGGTDGRKR